MKIITDLTPTADNKDIIYNSLDTMQTMALKKRFDGGLIPKWAKPTYEYSEKMLGPIYAMMRRGVAVDLQARDLVVTQLRDRHNALISNFDLLCETCFGTSFNYNSTPQLKLLFYSFLAIPEQRTSKRGESKVATDRSVLERIIKDFPRGKLFASFILTARDLEKQIEFLTKKLSPKNRFHTSYNLGGTETFRLSSSEHPLRFGSNQQNIPKHARHIFISDEEYLFFQADQQGAEARLVAYLSGDPNYIKAVESGDVHTAVASIVFGFEPDREIAEREYFRGYSYRDITKKGTHGASYYAKAFTMAQNLHIEVAKAEEFLKTFFTKFPGISEWHLAVAKQLQTKGYLTNPFGMRRNFWGRKWDDATLREAIAYGPQSTVGILTNVGLHRLWTRYENAPGAPVQILMNGHDAVIGQLRKDRAAELVPQILETLRFPFPVTDINGVTREVTIPFDLELGLNWGKASDANPNGLKKYTPPTPQNS